MQIIEMAGTSPAINKWVATSFAPATRLNNIGESVATRFAVRYWNNLAGLWGARERKV
jgi:hypothetical protein